MKLRRMLVALAAVIAIVAPVLHAEPAAAASPGEFVGSINGLRASKGLGSLSSNGALAGQAQRWAESMAAAGKISHNPNLGGTPGNWSKVGENVGTGGSVSSIFNALVASPGHYRNMVDGSYNSVGVGVAVGADGRLYTCHVFAAINGAGGGSAPAAKQSRVSKSSGSSAPAPKASSGPAPKAKASGGSAPASNASASNSAPASGATGSAAPADSSAPAAPTGPVPSSRIVAGLAEVGAIATQG